MSLHSIIEPAGTLSVGWGLVPDHDVGKADLRNKDKAEKPDPTEGDRTPPSVTASKWELAKVR